MKLDDSKLAIPDQRVSIDVLLEKYAKGGEQTVDEVRKRVARALAAIEADQNRTEFVLLTSRGSDTAVRRVKLK